MVIEIRETQRGTVLKVQGRLDVSWRETFLETALECVRRGQHQLHVDARELDYISSAGISALLLLQRELITVRGQLTLYHPRQFVERVLRTSGLGEWIDATVAVESLDELEAIRPTEDAAFRVDVLNQNATMRVFSPCQWQPWEPVRNEQICSVQLGRKRVAIGIGAPGAEPVGCRDRFGECVAVCGCLVWRPTDGGEKPDYLIQREQFVPELHAIQLCVAEGEFSHRFRFQSVGEGESVSLSGLLSRSMDQLQTERIVMVCVAEVDGLVGVALDRSPGLIEAGECPGVFPAIRDWLTFCGERLHARQTALVVAFAARESADCENAGFVPLTAVSGLWGHAHAVVMPHRPLPSGPIDLQEFVSGYFDAVAPLDVLHLIHDDRYEGLGESSFIRGGCWVAPWTADGGGELA